MFQKRAWARTPFGRGWLWFWSVVHSNSPLRPAAVDREGGQSERHRVSPPHARSWLCPHLPIDTHCTHVRAGLLLLRASVPRPRPAAPSPPRAACSTCQRHARGASRAPIQTTGWAGGKKLMTCHESTVSSCGFRSVLVWILEKCGVLKVLLLHGQDSCVVVAGVGVELAAWSLLALVLNLKALVSPRPPLSAPGLAPRKPQPPAAPAGGQAHWPQRGPAGPYPLWARLALVLACCSLQQPPAPRRGR